MSGIIADIMEDPGEYLPVLLILATLFLFWAALCLSGCASLLASTRRRRFGFALAPLLFGLIGVLAQIPILIEGEGFRVSFDFRWFFILPLVLGTAGVIKSAPATCPQRVLPIRYRG